MKTPAGSLEPRKFYPFGGPQVLISRLRKNRSIPPGRWPAAFLHFVNYLVRSPFGLHHRLFLKARVEMHTIEKEPIFILGHFRSGTTYLHKILAANPSWACLREYDLFLPFRSARFERLAQSVIDRFGIKHPHSHDYTINLNDPTEEDAYLLAAGAPWSAYWGYLFPEQLDLYFEKAVFFQNQTHRENWKRAYTYFIKWISYRSQGKRLILKNPPNTGRVAALLEAFPRAKFIYLFRNPYQVFYSMRKLWEKEIDLFSLQNISVSDKDAIIFALYRRMLTRYEEEKDQISPQNLIEIRYEDLIAAPEQTIDKILDGLDLIEEVDRHNILQRIQKETAYTSRSYRYDHQTLDAIYRHWGFFIDKWGYERPPSAGEQLD